MSYQQTNGVGEEEEWTPSLPSQRQLVNASRQAYLSARDQYQPHTPRGQRVVDEGRAQLLATAYEIMKTHTALQGESKMHQLSRDNYRNQLTDYYQQVAEVKSTPMEKPFKVYGQYDLDTQARQHQEILEVLHEKLISIQAQDVYKPEDAQFIVEQRPRGFKLFGG